MKRFYSRILASGLLLASAAVAGAVPARPGFMSYTQPDGSVVMLEQRGDEYMHYLQDQNGNIVDRAADGWYRILDANAQPTSLLAGDPKAAADPQATFNTLMARSMDSPLRRSAQQRRQARAAQRVVSKSKWDNSDGHDIRAIPTEGERHVLVILVNFSDLKWSFDANPGEEMKKMMNEPGYSGHGFTGSVRDYFMACSDGLYKPVFDVYGPVTLKNTCSFYGANKNGSDANAQQMVIDACNAIAGEVDFSIYDTDGDGYVDNIYVFYAGQGENDGGGPDTVWPHSFNLRYGYDLPKYNGVNLDHYACSNELNSLRAGETERQHSGIGTFCHEFGHVLGLPDLYATTYSGAYTPGRWTVMDQGSYNNNGRTPPLYSAYERYAMEWAKPVDITEPCTIGMMPRSNGGNAYRITIDSSRPTEYYLFENRQLSHIWDSQLPGHGMLVWHIDFNRSIWDQNVVNNSPDHLYCDLIEANNSKVSGTAGDHAFPGGNNVGEFTGSTTPAFANWSGRVTDLPLTAINESAAGVVSFNVGQATGSSALDVEAPAIHMQGADDSSVTVAWDKVPGALKYYVTVQKTYFDDYEEVIMHQILPGYDFVDMGEATTCQVKGLDEASTYTFEVYAATADNLSPAGEAKYSTFAADFTAVRPYLKVTPDTETALAEWVEVPGADAYQLTVATRQEGEREAALLVDFGENKVPKTWTYTGILDNTVDYYGKAAPSMKMSVQNGNILTSAFAKDLAAISFWARVNRSNPVVSLKVYGIDQDYNLTLLRDITDIDSSSDGSRITVDGLPAGIRQVLFIYTYRTSGLVLNIDDMEFDYAGTITDTPVAGYDKKAVSGTDHRVTGLERDHDYVAYLTATGSKGTTAPSQTVRFTTLQSSGIDGIQAGGQTAAFSFSAGTVTPAQGERLTVYTFDGRAVALNSAAPVQLPAPGLYIVVAAGQAHKLAW